MSAPLPLDALSLSRSSRQLLQRAGFHSRQAVAALRPTQLAHELGCTPALALSILREIDAAPARQKDEDDTDAGTAGEEKTTSSNDVKAPQQRLPIVHAAKVEPHQFGENALDLLRRRAGMKPIPAHCEPLDSMMGGGCPVGQITEFCGVPGAGKTQLCIQLACNVQIPKRLGGAWEGEAIYIDTEGSFLAERAASIAGGTVDLMRHKSEQGRQRQLAAGKSVSPVPVPTVDTLLQHIHVYRAYDHVEQLATIKVLPSFLHEHPNVHLLIIDSVAFHFRRGFTDMGLRARILTGMAQELLYLADKYQLAVVVTNQVTTRLDHSSTAASSAALAPALGESWAHSCTNRVMLDFEGTTRVARLLKSPTMRSTRVPYDITEGGITPVQQPTAAPLTSQMPMQTTQAQRNANPTQQPAPQRQYAPPQHLQKPHPQHPQQQRSPHTPSPGPLSGEKRKLNM